MSAAPRMYLSPPHIGSREQALVGEVFASNWIAPIGPMIDAFEAGLARATGIDHVVALSSGTAGLHLALRMIGIGPGDEVWGSTLTFIGGVAPILYMGAAPVFLDIEADGYLLDLDLLESALAAAVRPPRVVITTDLYGHVTDAGRMRALADRFGFVWISDAAEAVGAYRDGMHAGKGADFAILSFNGNKIITTSGGGMLVTEEKAFAERARFLATQARDPAPHYQHSTIGYNYRMSNILAGVGRGQLKVLDQRVRSRRAVYDRYREAFAGVNWIELMPEPDWSFSTHWISACVLAPDARISAADMIQRLSAELIEARPVWKPMQLQPVFAHCEYFSHGEESVSEELFNNGVCLPSGSNMTVQQIDRVAETVLKIGKHMSSH
jgi:dTDP-4-amino-4,6-dideoxygalactose transaminase